MSKLIIKISFLVLLLNPNLSWGKNYITCAGASESEFEANIYNFEINKSELKREKWYLNVEIPGLKPDADFFHYRGELLDEYTRVVDDTIFIYTGIYNQDELYSYMETFHLDILSGFMILRKAYIDKETEEVFIYDSDGNKVFQGEKEFNRLVDKSYYECRKVEPLFE